MPAPRAHLPLLLASLTAFLAVLAFSACGASNSVTRIQGSSATITKPMLDHWMRAVVATDFRVNIGTKAPRGLVSEPANPSECAQAAKKIIPRTFTGTPKLGDAQIAKKCRELHEAVKTQAMAYLLSAQWTMLEAKELHIPLTEAELHKEFQRYLMQNYKNSQAKFHQYLDERQLVPSDVLYQLKRNILVTRILPKFKARVQRAGGGEKTYAKLVTKRYHGLIAKTSCQPGYVMEDCKQYHKPPNPPLAPADILEALTQGIPG